MDRQYKDAKNANAPQVGITWISIVSLASFASVVTGKLQPNKVRHGPSFGNPKGDLDPRVFRQIIIFVVVSMLLFLFG